MKPSFTRRGFVASAIAFPYALRSFAQSAESTRWVFLGTDKGSGIYRCSWNSATGKLGLPELAVRCERPAFFALHPKLPLLYAVNSVAGPGAGLTAFRLAPNSGTLSAVSRQTSKGDGPCYVSVDATGRSAFVANYSGGSFTAYGLTVDGLLLPPTGTLSCHQAPACGNPGPVTDRQDASHLHCAVTSPGNDFVLACDLGNDAIEVLAIKPGEDNPLGSAKRFAARPGSGPRHLAFHPNRRWVYVIHELDCTLELFDWSVAGGRSSLVRRDGTAISTLAAGAALAGNSACELLLSPDGRFLYACTRGEDSLAVFRINSQNGTLTEQQRLSCCGKVPRHIAFDPSRRFLLCANQAAPGSVSVFAHDPETARLSGPIQTLPADTPMFVQFV